MEKTYICCTCSFGCHPPVASPSCLFFGVGRNTLATISILTDLGNDFNFQRPSDGEAEQKVVEYAFKALDALGVKFGPTHTGEG